MNPASIRLAGAGRAYQAVAQSAAIAIQDATDYLRNVSTISATAIGVGMAQVVATQGQKGKPVIEEAQKVLTQTIATYTSITQAATQVATNFPQSLG